MATEPIEEETMDLYWGGETLIPFTDAQGDHDVDAASVPKIPGSVRSAPDAVTAARLEVRHPSQNWTGYCLKFVRTMRNVQLKYSDANESWAHSPVKHYNNHPPKGVPFYYSVGTHGHVVMADENGYCFSTDVLREGKVDRISLGAPVNSWNAKGRGWSPYLNGKLVYLGTILSVSVIRDATKFQKKYVYGPKLKQAIRRELKKHGVKPARMNLVAKRLGKSYFKNAKKLQHLYGHSLPVDGLLGNKSLTRLLDSQLDGHGVVVS